MNKRAATMARQYESGFTLQEIADDFGISRQRVHQLISSFGIKAHGGRRKREERVERLREAHARIAAGKSTAVFESERLGYKSVQYLYGEFWKLGLRLRKKGPQPHGTIARYTHQRCRCARCRKAAREKRLENYERGPKEHGTVSAYKNFGCHCPKCKQAMRLHEKERRRQKRMGELRDDKRGN